LAALRDEALLPSSILIRSSTADAAARRSLTVRLAFFGLSSPFLEASAFETFAAVPLRRPRDLSSLYRPLSFATVLLRKTVDCVGRGLPPDRASKTLLSRLLLVSLSAVCRISEPGLDGLTSLWSLARDLDRFAPCKSLSGLARSADEQLRSPPKHFACVGQGNHSLNRIVIRRNEAEPIAILSVPRAGLQEKR
jgi:hypothetical protein